MFWFSHIWEQTCLWQIHTNVMRKLITLKRWKSNLKWEMKHLLNIQFPVSFSLTHLFPYMTFNHCKQSISLSKQFNLFQSFLARLKNNPWTDDSQFVLQKPFSKKKKTFLTREKKTPLNEFRNFFLQLTFCTNVPV